MSSDIRIRPLVLIGIVAIALLSACSTTQPGAPIQVQMLEGQKAQVGNKVVDIDALPRLLKSLGATNRTQISVHVPADASEQTFSGIGGRLAENGYPRVVFVKPQKTEADVKRARDF